MTTPDTPSPLAALREAEWAALDVLLRCEPGTIEDDADAYRDAVAARVRAELLASGTPLWVQDDGGDVHVYTGPDPEHMRHECAIDRVRISPDRPLTPPGTVRRGVLVIPEEEA